MQCWNTEGIFRLIQSIPSPKAEPFKRWLARIGYEPNKKAANDGGTVAGNARCELEKQSGRKVVTSENYLALTQSAKKKKILQGK